MSRMSTLARSLVLGVALAGSLFIAGSAAAQGQLNGLFAPAGVDALVPQTDTTAMRSRSVRVDFDQLRSSAARADASSAIVLNLFPEVILTATLDRVDRTATGFVWVGHVPAVPMSSVTLSTEGGVLYGSVLTPDGAYIIKPSADDAYVITQIDRSRFRPEAPPLVPGPAPAAEAREPVNPQEAQGDDGSVIDVMVLYTPAAAAAAGGTSAMNALINN